jgi:hypothetical protein
VFEASIGVLRDFSLLAVAAQFGAVRCAQFLLANGARVQAAEVEAAFRGGNAELMRLLWDACPRANPVEIAVEATKSWNMVGLRWLLDHKMGALSSCDVLRLFEKACLSGSYWCGSSVLGFGASAASHIGGLRPVGVVGRVLLRGSALLKSGRCISLHRDDSMAAAYEEELSEWLPGATGFRLVARRESRGAASVNAFIDAAKGRAKTLTFVETENGGSICGGYLDVPWVEDGWANDPGRRSFIFTLRNHLGVPPTKFAQKRDYWVAYAWRDSRFRFGDGEGFVVCQGDPTLWNGQAYEAPGQGVTLFNGDEGGVFRAARWELWEVE